MSGCRSLLRPIARLLLKSGVTWKEFAALAKRAFVDVATDYFGKRGRPTNVSRVAMLTGMTRLEVRRLRALTQADPDAPAGYMSKASRVLSGWHQDPDFVDAEGGPLLLSQEGEGKSFVQLARRYGGDIPPVAVLKELQASGAVVKMPDGRLRAAMRDYLPLPMDPAQIRLWASALTDLGATLEYNLSRAPARPARFERRALNVRVAAQALPAFREFLEREGQAFLERVDDWLTAHAESPSPSRDGVPMRLGCGLYHIEDERQTWVKPLSSR